MADLHEPGNHVWLDDQPWTVVAASTDGKDCEIVRGHVRIYSTPTTLLLDRPRTTLDPKKAGGPDDEQ